MFTEKHLCIYCNNIIPQSQNWKEKSRSEKKKRKEKEEKEGKENETTDTCNKMDES